ncbi:hypothetical protein JKF63_05651 [Porcisia hertigi]|uniref:Ssl1-like domain-containing protein n=1 Tax=Porcisia hertigi TaxID=2761500 RepID=A0A836L924_9TRYP|nr:hypothetical protein JKF63_05651 [Porcisia hertigi]
MLRTVLLLDGSDAMNNNSDYLPNYLLAMRPPLLRFVERYLDSTPLASLGVVVMRDGVSHRLLPCTTNHNEIVDALERDYFLHGGSGNTSMENGLRMAMSELVNMREVAALTEAAAKTSSSSIAARDPRAAWKGSATQLNIIVFIASVTLIDPTDVFAVVNIMAALSIRISIVSLVGAVHVYEVCAAQTGGTLYCPLNYDHLLHIIDESSTSHRAIAMTRKKGKLRGGRQQRTKRSREDGDGDDDGSDAPRLIPIGCPVYLKAPASDSTGPSSTASSCSLYLACPQCHLIQLTVPTTCSMCRLLLCSAPMLYSTFVSHNSLAPPAKLLRVIGGDTSVSALTATTTGATSTSVLHEDGVVQSTMQKPLRCSLCMTSILAEEKAKRTLKEGLDNPAVALPRAAAAVSRAQVWQCSACASYRCNACNDFVLHTVGLCPDCVALQW